MRSQRSLKMKTIFAAGSIVAGSLASGGAAAQGTTITITDLGLSEAQSRALINDMSAPAASPGLSFGSPVGFGADWGEIGIGVGGQTLPDTAPTEVDGSMGAVIGFGDATRYVGLEASVNIISLRQGFGEDGALGFKLHTSLPGRAGFAVGVTSVAGWGSAEDTEESVYAVGTKFFDVGGKALAMNIGIGDNAFNSIDQVCVAPNNCFDSVDSGANVFGGVAFYPMQQLSVIADWTGRSLNLGVSAAPFRSVPLVGTIGVLNVTGDYQGRQFGEDAEFGAGIGYTFKF